jgi:hypothetical protein
MMDEIIIMRRNDGQIGVFYKGPPARAFVLSKDDLCNIMTKSNNKEIRSCFDETPLSFLGIGAIRGSKTAIKDVLRRLNMFEVK